MVAVVSRICTFSLPRRPEPPSTDVSHDVAHVYQHSRTRRALSQLRAWKDDAPEEISVAQVPRFGDALLPEERSLVVARCLELWT